MNRFFLSLIGLVLTLSGGCVSVVPSDDAQSAALPALKRIHDAATRPAVRSPEQVKVYKDLVPAVEKYIKKKSDDADECAKNVFGGKVEMPIEGLAEVQQLATRAFGGENYSLVDDVDEALKSWLVEARKADATRFKRMLKELMLPPEMANLPTTVPAQSGATRPVP